MGGVVVESFIGHGMADRQASGLSDICQRLEVRFRRSEVRDTSRRYLEALVGRVERKNCWQLAEAAGDDTPDSMQRLLRTAKWDPDPVRDDLRNYVVEYLGDPGSVLVVDETGFLKKGNKSAGVQRQYSGTAGKIENCQIGVFLAYVSPRGTAFIDRELYLPESWTSDRQRCQEAHVPDEMVFTKKPELARRMLKRAFDAGIPCQWVTGDEIYGNGDSLRTWLEGRCKGYVLAVGLRTYIWWRNAKGQLVRWRLEKLVSDMEETDWQRLSVGDGGKGPRVYDWTWARLPEAGTPPPSGWARWLVVRRSVSKPEERAYFIAGGPEGQTLKKLAQVAGKRWGIEQAFAEAKGEAGLDEYEVRRYDGWYRHITLSLFAHAYLVVLRLVSKEGKGGRKQA